MNRYRYCYIKRVSFHIMKFNLNVLTSLIGLTSLLIGFVLVVMGEMGAAFFFTAVGIVIYLYSKRVMEKE